MLLSASAFLLAFVLLFSFRAHDDNRLFSWLGVFSRTDGSRIYLLLIAALTGAVLLARYRLPEQHDVLLLMVLPLAAVLPFWREPETIVDAARYFTQAKQLAQEGTFFFLKEWGRTIGAWTDLPLVPFCYGILFRLFGESRMVIQAFTSLLFSLTVVLTYRIGRMLWDRETDLTAGLLLLGIPYLLAQVPLMLVDVPTMFLLMLSLAAFLDALDLCGAAGERTDLAAEKPDLVAKAAALMKSAHAEDANWPLTRLAERRRADRQGASGEAAALASRPPRAPARPMALQ